MANLEVRGENQTRDNWTTGQLDNSTQTESEKGRSGAPEE